LLEAPGVGASHKPCVINVDQPLQVANTSVEPGSNAVYSCITGYQLVGNSTRYCNLHETLEGTDPTCVLIYCPDLSTTTTSPLFVSMSALTYVSNGVATYTCAVGYSLSGSSTRSCQANGTWDGSSPTCSVVTCPNLTTTNPLLITVSNFNYIDNGVATYNCTIGYLMSGSDTRTCQVNGTWSGSEPTCSIVTCPSLFATLPLSLRAPNLTYDSNATYSCATGYSMTGFKTRTCQVDGTWSGSEPTCSIVTCPALSASVPLYVNAATLTYNSNATYSCAIGYYVIGFDTRTCQADGTWSGSEPTCSIVMCPPLSVTSPLLVSAPTLTYNSNVTYFCAVGYLMSRSNPRTCQADGTWSDSEPTCSIVTCPPLSPASPLRVSAINITYNSVATYFCETGHSLTGSDTSTCQADGSWSGSEPTCSIVTCPPLNVTSPLSVSAASITYNSDATYACEIGYLMSGFNPRTCQADGTWSGTAPACIIVSCPTLTEASPLSVNVSSLTYFSVATYLCIIGYSLSGSSTRTCLADGTWSGLAPTCDIITCPTLSASSPLLVNVVSVNFGDVVTYSCEVKYKINGTSFRTCQSDGTWGDSEPTCTLITCPNITAPINGHVNFSSGIGVGGKAIFGCNRRFVLSDNRTATCTVAGTWDIARPTCLYNGKNLLLLNHALRNC